VEALTNEPVIVVDGLSNGIQWLSFLAVHPMLPHEPVIVVDGLSNGIHWLSFLAVHPENYMVTYIYTYIRACIYLIHVYQYGSILCGESVIILHMGTHCPMNLDCPGIFFLTFQIACR
jgi:hypothetical protein